MSRSTKKGFYVQPALMKKVEAMKDVKDKKIIQTWSRASTIFPEFVGNTIGVYDGHKFVSSLLHVSSAATPATRNRLRTAKEEYRGKDYFE